MKRTIITSNDMRDSNLDHTSQRIIEKLENNPAFPNPPAALAHLKVVLPEFRDALVKAKGRDKEMVAIKNKQRVAVLSLLTELSEFVSLASKGDEATILSSGFDVTDDRSGYVAPSAQSLDVELKPEGEVTIRVKHTAGVKAYMHQYATEPPGPQTVWTSVGSSKRSCTFKGLTSDKRYWFRVVVIGSNGQVAYSPVVSRPIF